MSRSLEEIIRDGTYTPLRKTRGKPYLSLALQPYGCWLLVGRTWEGKKIFTWLSREEVEEWNRNLAALQRKFLEEGQ